MKILLNSILILMISGTSALAGDGYAQVFCTLKHFYSGKETVQKRFYGTVSGDQIVAISEDFDLQGVKGNIHIASSTNQSPIRQLSMNLQYDSSNTIYTTDTRATSKLRGHLFIRNVVIPYHAIESISLGCDIPQPIEKTD